MDAVLNVEPGLLIWTLINFGLFLILLIAFGTKPIMKGLKAREESIQSNIDGAHKANEDAKVLLDESQDKLNNAQVEMAEIIKKGREQAEAIISKATDEADKIKRQKVEDATKEIERSKVDAIKELRREVAGLVVSATEKILDETLDKDKHYKLVESYIEKLPKN
jgi:F-type H+-transporting ATPase subunit b